MNLWSVDSSVIAAVGYDPQARVMVVLFNSGKAYEYHHVPPDIYAGMMSACSKGQFLNHQVLGVFPYRIFRGWGRLKEDGLLQGRKRTGTGV